MHQDGVREGATPFLQRVVGTGSVSQKEIPVGVGEHVAELGGLRLAAEADVTTPGRRRQAKQALACLIKSNENTVQPTEGMEKIAMHGLIQRIVSN